MDDVAALENADAEVGGVEDIGGGSADNKINMNGEAKLY